MTHIFMGKRATRDKQRRGDGSGGKGTWRVGEGQGGVKKRRVSRKFHSKQKKMWIRPDFQQMNAGLWL